MEKCLESNRKNRPDVPKVDSYLEILTPYLNMWNERQVIEDEESELVELFDGNHLGGSSDRESGNNSLGYATASDCMSCYIGRHSFYRSFNDGEIKILMLILL